ncbi:MAG: hypothetical protein QXR29_01825 [Candidatus Micrarchaeaceae archaeon]
MALEAIEKEIERKAAESAASIRREAEAEAEHIVEEAKAKAKQLLEEAKKSAESDAANIKASGAADAEYEAASIIAEARSKAAEKETAIVKRLIERELESHIAELLGAAMKAFANAAKLDGAKIEINKKYADAAKAYGIDVVASDVDGFIIKSDDGKVVLDGKLHDMVERYSSSVIRAVSEALQGQSTKGAAAQDKRKAAKAKHNTHTIKSVKR